MVTSGSRKATWQRTPKTERLKTLFVICLLAGSDWLLLKFTNVWNCKTLSLTAQLHKHAHQSPTAGLHFTCHDRLIGDYLAQNSPNSGRILTHDKNVLDRDRLKTPTKSQKTETDTELAAMVLVCSHVLFTRKPAVSLDWRSYLDEWWNISLTDEQDQLSRISLSGYLSMHQQIDMIH